MPVFAPGATSKPLSVVFLSSSEFEEVVLEENWYFLFTVMGMLQLSRYLRNRKSEIRKCIFSTCSSTKVLTITIHVYTHTLTWWHCWGSWFAGRSRQSGLCRWIPPNWLHFCLCPAEGALSPSDAPLDSSELLLKTTKKWVWPFEPIYLCVCSLWATLHSKQKSLIGLTLTK